MSRAAPANASWSWPRRLIAGLGAAGAGLALAVTALTLLDRRPPIAPQPAPVADAATLARGAYLARVGNCAGCHTARGGAALAGGRPLPTPFGTVYAGNLTPDAATGLGRWSADDFWQALHHGRSRDGRLLTPAFPYTAFTRVSRADSDALYVHLRSLAPVAQAQPPSSLRFPFNTQAAMAVWRALYFRPVDGPGAVAAPADPRQRGEALVQGLGHCAACHAPRNALGATRLAEALPGGEIPLQGWYAPALGPVAGTAPAQQRQGLRDLLRTGMSPQGVAAGPMAEVVTGSTQHWSDEDLEAAVTYLLSLPPQPAPVRAAGGGVAVDTPSRTRGARLYADRCATCHGDQGEGAPGIYPPLAGNPSVTMASPANALQVIRHGGFAPATRAQPRPFGMPPADLSPEQQADVLNFIRQTWGNGAGPVELLDVLRLP